MYYHEEGIFTKQAHKGIPAGHFEEEQGRKGFFGPVSHLIRKKPSTRWRSIEGHLKPRMFDVAKLDPAITCQRLFYNNDVTTFIGYKKPIGLSTAKDAFRNAEGDSIYFCHRGKGVVLTEYGLIHYREGDYIMLPKCIAHTILPEVVTQFFTIVGLYGGFTEPDRGIVGRQGVYDTSQLRRPNLKEQEEFIQKNKINIVNIDVAHNDEITRFTYDESIYDVIGWKGDFFPFCLNMDQIMPLMSHRAHLPPSAHTTFVAQNFVVCSFVPRPLESDQDALRVPFYHQNIDYDEILFYHNGDFFSRANLHPGMISFHPAGFPHGPHPKAIDRVKNETHTNEYAVMLDARRPLQRDPFLDQVEVKDYWQSWQK